MRRRSCLGTIAPIWGLTGRSITAKSPAFKQRIERIHRLLEAEDPQVIWKDHIPDPDNPTQSRQIDVSIRRDGSLTHVECRIHKEPQDVTWIEERIGRRASLRADAVIAVSSSGFTQGAQLKAEAHGIILIPLPHPLESKSIVRSQSPERCWPQ